MQALSQSGQSVRARVEARVQGGGGRRKGSGFSLGFELHDVPFSFPCPPPHTHTLRTHPLPCSCTACQC